MKTSMSNILALSYMMVMTGCASAILDENNMRRVDKAIDNNDHKKVHDLIADKENGAYEYSCLLNSLLNLAASDKVCRPEIVQLLLNKGALISEERKTVRPKGLSGVIDPNAGCEIRNSLYNAMNSYCPDVLGAIASKASYSDKIASLSVGVHISQKTDIRKRSIDTLQIVKQWFESTCKQKGELDASCAALEKITEEEKLDEQRITKAKAREDLKEEKKLRYKVVRRNAEQERLFADSPEGIKKQACEILNSIKHSEQMIEHENEVGRVSGVINKATLHEAGEWKMAGERSLKQKKKIYKEKTGKDLVTSDCKIEPLDY